MAFHAEEAEAQAALREAVAFHAEEAEAQAALPSSPLLLPSEQRVELPSSHHLPLDALQPMQRLQRAAAHRRLHERGGP